jgi:antirestriction protein ArdC
MKPERFDSHQHITNRIIAALEAGPGEWQKPWRQTAGGRPRNIASGKAYRGVNTLALWVEAMASGYSSSLWGTYRQWAERGAQVRKGAKASYVVFYKEIATQETDPETGERQDATRLFARATPVFNADQVEGLAIKTAAPATPVDPHAAADALIAANGARIVTQGQTACYIPALDEIRMPARELFTGSVTSSPTETYYATLLHELTHFTAAPGRCDRDLSARFGTNAYAMEELIAELGAAYLCADLGITAEPRADHAQYLAFWLDVLKQDAKAIFTAASKADQAVRFLTGEGA